MNIQISIAEILIEVHSPISANELGITERFRFFLGKVKNPKWHVSLCWHNSDITPFLNGELIYQSGDSWCMYRDGQLQHALFNYNELKLKGIISTNSTWDELVLTEQCSDTVRKSLLSIGAGELLLRTKMILTNGLVFHASGIDYNGRAIVFIGHSGEGKSTQADLWNKYTNVILINHDRIAIRSYTSGAVCYGIPWGGSANITLNHNAPLAALILIEQATENDIAPLTPAAAAPLLAARAFLPYWDQALMRCALDNLNAILQQVPVYRLRCRPEREAISLVRSVV